MEITVLTSTARLCAGTVVVSQPSVFELQEVRNKIHRTENTNTYAESSLSAMLLLSKTTIMVLGTAWKSNLYSVYEIALLWEL